MPGGNQTSLQTHKRQRGTCSSLKIMEARPRCVHTDDPIPSWYHSHDNNQVQLHPSGNNGNKHSVFKIIYLAFQRISKKEHSKRMRIWMLINPQHPAQSPLNIPLNSSIFTPMTSSFVSSTSLVGSQSKINDFPRKIYNLNSNRNLVGRKISNSRLKVARKRIGTAAFYPFFLIRF